MLVYNLAKNSAGLKFRIKIRVLCDFITSFFLAAAGHDGKVVSELCHHFKLSINI